MSTSLFDYTTARPPSADLQGLEMAATGAPLKVALYVFFPSGGIGRYSYELARALNRRPGVSVEVVCTPDFEWKDEDGYATWQGLASISHATVFVRKLRFLQGQFVNPLRCIRHAVESGADIVHFSNINHLSFPYWRDKLRRSGLKVAVSAHDVKRQKAILSRGWEERQLKAFYRFADALFVHSSYQADELVSFAGVAREHIHVVPHGPYPYGTVRVSREAMRRRLELPADGQVALFFGQIRDEKNLQGLIRALAQSTSRPHLVVAGKSGGRHRDVDYYQAVAQEAGVAHLVRFLPRYISDDEVGDLFNMADWVALPYHHTFTSQSGVLNVAAHYERPVLVSTSPVLRETIATCDIGVVAEAETASGLAAGIDALCARCADGYHHQFAAYRERFSWEENARCTVAAYAALL